MGCCGTIDISQIISTENLQLQGKKVSNLRNCQFDRIEVVANKYRCIRCGRLSGKIDTSKVSPRQVAANCKGPNLLGDYIEIILKFLFIHALFYKLFKKCGCEYRKFLMNKLDQTYGLSFQCKAAAGIIRGYLQGFKLFLYWCRSLFKYNP
jgi:hypothetical protein